MDRLTAMRTFVEIVDEGVDLALRIGELADTSMVAVRVGQVRHIVCASPALLERTGRPSHPGELAKLPCIRQQNLARRQTWRFRENGRSLPVRIDGRFGCNQIAAALSACSRGTGFAQFLSYQVSDLVRDGKLVIVLKDFEPAPLPVNLVYPGGRLVSARLRALIDWLRGNLGGAG